MRFPVFKMTILKIFLVFITMACPSITDQIDDDLKQFKEFLVLDAYLLQTENMPDRGYIARRDVSVDELMSKDMEFVEQYTSTLEKELECSFAFSALVQIYLTDVYLAEQEKLNIFTREELNDVTFMGEALYILLYALDKQKFNLLDVMWIYNFLALRTYNCIKSTKTGTESLNNKMMLTGHAIVKKVLEEFTESYECKVYNQETGETQNVKYADKIEEVIEEGRTNNTPLTLASNKLRFSKQQRSNAYQETELSKLVHFRLYFLMNDRRTMGELFNAFGVNVDSKPIVDHFYRRHLDTYNVDVPLHEYINCFITSQIEFITTLKAMALRFVLVLLNCMRNQSATLSTFTRITMLNSVHGKCIKQMTTFLTNFASFVGQPNDYHLNKVKSIFSNYFWNFRTVSQYDKYINSVLDSITDMTFGNSEFATLSCPLTEKDYTMWMTDEIENKYDLIYSQDFNSIEKIIMVADIFITYIQKITGGIDIGVMNSLFRLKESDPYKRLADLERKAELI